ncbi:MAG: peptidoglycan recognition family protein [Planctomycetota bacterium]
MTNPSPEKPISENPTNPMRTGTTSEQRRSVLRTLLGFGISASAAGLLGACASSSSSRPVSRVGEPLGYDPNVAPVAKTPVITTKYRPLPHSSLSGASLSSAAIDRREWARFGPNPRLADRMGRITRITIHHDGINAFTSTDTGDAARRLEQIRRAHVARGWADIGYHFAVDPAGRVWEGRPLDLQGAHVGGHNPGNLGIVVMGNYEIQRPTRASVQSLEALVRERMAYYDVDPRRVRTHREYKPTACPGRHLQREIDVSRAPGGAIATA